MVYFPVWIVKGRVLVILPKLCMATSRTDADTPDNDSLRDSLQGRVLNECCGYLYW